MIQSTQYNDICKFISFETCILIWCIRSNGVQILLIHKIRKFYRFQFHKQFCYARVCLYVNVNLPKKWARLRPLISYIHTVSIVTFIELGRKYHINDLLLCNITSKNSFTDAFLCTLSITHTLFHSHYVRGGGGSVCLLKTNTYNNLNNLKCLAYIYNLQWGMVVQWSALSNAICEREKWHRDMLVVTYISRVCTSFQFISFHFFSSQ